MDSTLFSMGASALMMVLVFGGMGAYYVFFLKKRLSPEGQAAYLASLGYRPGEGLVTMSMGELLFVDERETAETALQSILGVGGPTTVQVSVTTHGRVLLDVGGCPRWFEANALPHVRPIGRIYEQDTTGVLDVLANQRETTITFVRDGRQPPPGAVPRRRHDAYGALHPVHVLELSAPHVAPVRFEAPEPVVVALCQLAARAHAPVPAPIPQYAPAR